MTSAAIDLLITATALAATLIAILSVRPARRVSPVAARLTALYWGLALLLAARLAAWSGGEAAGLAAVPLMIVASWLPLLALRVAEQVVRRHAPAWVKWLALAGAAGFSLVALLAGAFWGLAVLAALALFQALMVLVIVHLLWRGQAGDLAPAEARSARILGAALLLSIPLFVTDFQVLAGLPVRGGAFAVLLLVLATARLAEGTASLALLLADALAVLAVGLLVGAAAWLIWPGASGHALVQACAAGAAAGALALILQRRSEARLVARAQPSLIATLAGLPDDADRETLLAAHPLLAAGRIVEGEALAPYPEPLIAALARRRVVTAGETGEAGDAARDLLDAYAATHLVRLSARPPCFLAVSAGALGADTLTAELDVLARLLDGGRG